MSKPKRKKKAKNNVIALDDALIVLEGHEDYDDCVVIQNRINHKEFLIGLDELKFLRKAFKKVIKKRKLTDAT